MPTSTLRRPLSVLLVTLLSVTLTGAAVAAPERPGPREGDHPTYARNDETGRIGFIGTRPGRPIDPGAAPGASPAAVATGFLRKNAVILGLSAPETDLRVTSEHTTAWGGLTVRVQQVHEGIPVLGGAFTVGLDEHRDVLSVLGEASPISRATVAARTTARSARRAAVQHVAKAEDVRPGRLAAARPDLMFYDPRLLGADSPFQSARLSWVTEVHSADGRLGHLVVVDATTGTVSLSFSLHAEARDRRVCDANNATAHLPCTAPVWTETSQPGGQDADVAAAFDFSGDTYSFFFDRFGRDSLDDAGMPLISTVDYCSPTDPCPYQNAFWNGSQMVYGDGFAAADDVVGHELAHGVTDFSSSLFYYMQSGAINESMSDIFGELIDQTNGAGDDSAGVRWLLGEDIPGIGAIRNMAHPPAFLHADRMRSAHYYGGPDDNGGVHWNSGVGNKAAYLLTDGGTFNGQTVTGLGATKTARLFYTANNDLLVSGSDYADLANALRQACSNLAGAGTDGLIVADCVQVDRALLATEMDLNPLSGATSIAAPCPTHAPVYTYRDDLETDTGQFTVMSIVGTEVWSYPQNPNGIFDATYATSGETNIWGYNRPSVSDSALRMTSAVTVPSGGYLHFQHAYGFEDDPSGTYDGGVVEYSTSGAGGPWVDAGPLFTAAGGAGGYDGTISAAFDNPLGGRAAFVSDSHGYGASRADLSSLAGQNVMFRWRIGTDGSFDDYGWFIDDISILRCVAPDTTPPETSIDSGPAHGSTIGSPDAVFGFSSSEPGSTFTCGLDGGVGIPCTSPHLLSGLADGSHTFSVAATDAAGNTDPTPATRTFTVAIGQPDTTAPRTKVTKHPKRSTSSRKAVFRFRAVGERGVIFECKLDRGRWQLCTSPAKYRVSKGKKHKFQVRAIDAAGNVDHTPAKWRWRVRR